MWWMISTAFGVTEGVALESWTAQLSGLAIPAECRIASADTLLRIDCGGTALLLEAAADGDDPRASALSAQLAPFVEAGMSVSAPEARTCTVSGVVRDCLEARVVPVAGPPMVVLSGMDVSASWVGTCLHRESELPAICQSIFTIEPH
ncbi:MAG: hypothetical protein ACI8S6_004084 [Myxococcota bacterium]|jgi:hypothetical protein